MFNKIQKAPGPAYEPAALTRTNEKAWEHKGVIDAAFE
jgi:hypothetical protein